MKKQGFTFVELLVVVTIMAVIFAATAVSYSQISKNTRDARRKSDLENIRQALEMCRSLSGTYPTSIYQISASQITCNDSNMTVTLKETPIDPKPCASHTDGKYSYVPSLGGYTLTADCMEGTTIKVVTNP